MQRNGTPSGCDNLRTSPVTASSRLRSSRCKGDCLVSTSSVPPQKRTSHLCGQTSSGPRPEHGPRSLTVHEYMQPHALSSR